MADSAILFAELTPDPDWEDRFNTWVDRIRAPQRLALPGFNSAHHYKDEERDTHLMVYELDDAAAVESDAFVGLEDHPHVETRWMLDNALDPTFYVGNLIDEQKRDDAGDDPYAAPILYAVFWSVPDERIPDFNAWYDGENTPLLLKCPDWLACRRYELVDTDPEPWTHVALHYIKDMAAFDSEERAHALGAPGRTKLEEEPWFQAKTLVYLKIGDRHLPVEE